MAKKTLVARVFEDYVTNDDGRSVMGVVAQCPECGETAEAYGTHERSIKRALITLKEQCGCATYFVAN